MNFLGSILDSIFGGSNDSGGNAFSGTPEKYGRIRTGTPEASAFQRKLFNKKGLLGKSPLYQEGSNYLQQLLSGGDEAFQRFEEPYMRNFNENISPDIANRFAGMGTGNSGLSSSGFQQTLAQAGKGLQGDLAAMRSGLQMQALPQALNYAQQPINNQLNAMQWSPYQTTHTPRQPGIADSAAQLAPGLLQTLLSSFLG